MFVFVCVSPEEVKTKDEVSLFVAAVVFPRDVEKRKKNFHARAHLRMSVAILPNRHRAAGKDQSSPRRGRVWEIWAGVRQKKSSVFLLSSERESFKRGKKIMKNDFPRNAPPSTFFSFNLLFSLFAAPSLSSERGFGRRAFDPFAPSTFSLSLFLAGSSVSSFLLRFDEKAEKERKREKKGEHERNEEASGKRFAPPRFLGKKWKTTMTVSSLPSPPSGCPPPSRAATAAAAES